MTTGVKESCSVERDAFRFKMPGGNELLNPPWPFQRGEDVALFKAQVSAPLGGHLHYDEGHQTAQCRIDGTWNVIRSACG